MVSFYEFRQTGGDFSQHDNEVESVDWMPVEKALHGLTFDGEREMLRLATGE